jgi:predicted lactoylglutathione lyase
VDVIVAAMQHAGVKPLFPAQEHPEFGPGFYAVTFVDPDQNVVEFGHRAQPAPTAV